MHDSDPFAHLSISATRRLQWCSGHRVFKHESKCAHMHGHNYVGFFSARPKKGLDTVGRVIDFSVLKEKIMGWIDAHWDHGFICYREDMDVRLAVQAVTPRKMYVMDQNPTAENMAAHLLHDIFPVIFKDTDVEIHRIVLYETENGIVEVSLQN